MTDNEIIQALKCCYDLDSSAICHQCPLYQTEECRDGYLGLQAYHLINHQQAEIERLEKIRKADDNLITSLNKCYETAKAEAYKEFAEKLKEKLGDCHIVSDGEYCGFNCGDIHECVDTLIKAMVGEKE